MFQMLENELGIVPQNAREFGEFNIKLKSKTKVTYYDIEVYVINFTTSRWKTKKWYNNGLVYN